MFAVVDIETTGGSFKNEKITEIAIYIFDGEKIVDEFVTLVNPEKNIPFFITNLTGISNEMVADSPRFYEIAKQIVDITKDKIFVAHNATFDYNFIRQEFKTLGYDFKMDTLCTVKMSRKLFPGYKSYSLGEICNHLQIGIESRHRAAGDALATVKLFKKILVRNEEAGNLVPIYKEKFRLPDGLHPEMTLEKINALPEETGIYYLLNEKQDILYIGKSKNIKTRVQSHLRNKASRKSIEMASAVVEIGYELCGNELIALLLESDEIKKHKPIYNRMQRRTAFSYALTSFQDVAGYMHLHLEKSSIGCDPVTTFHNLDEGKAFIEEMIDKYNLCQKFCGLYESAGACFYQQVGKCQGACTGNEAPEKYNERVKKLIDYCSLGNKSFLILSEGRTEDEISVVKVLNGAYCGFEFFNISSQITDWSELSESIPVRADNRDVRMIIKSYILKHPKLKFIKI